MLMNYPGGSHAPLKRRQAYDQVTIVLEIPSRDLSPNGRPSRWSKARATKAYRMAANWACCAQYPGFAPHWENVEILATGYFPTRAARDADNFQSSLKSGIDGICDAGLIANDKGVRWLPVVFEVDKERPRIEIRIREV